MKNLTLIIPTKNEVESLPIFLGELKDFECSKLIKRAVNRVNIINHKNFTNSFRFIY